MRRDRDRSCAPKELSPEEAVALIPSNSNVFLHGACATPLVLEQAMCLRADLHNVKLYHMHKNGPAPFAAPELADRFCSVSVFGGSNVRQAIQEGRADCVPIFLSDIPWLYLNDTVHLHAALISVSPPDAHGYCTLGTSVDSALAAVQSADIVIAEVNEQMPRTYGQSAIHMSEIDVYTPTNHPLCYAQHGRGGPAEDAIGEIIANIIQDGDTLQLGIGAIPDAVLSRLTQKNDLGIHTEMFSDGLVPLAKSGVLSCRRKTLHPNRIVTSFISGGQTVVDFVADNPLVEFYPCNYTNDTSVIRQNDNMVAINGAIEIDLTGQVCADSIGPKIYSGFGGQLDFIRGAALAKNGRAIIALPATAKSGTISRIVPMLKQGAGVVTTRAHVKWVVTEFGAVNLNGRSLRERAEMLISIAHPDFRAELTHAVNELRHFTLS